METRVPGGYAVVTVQQLANICALKKAKRISFVAVRVWLAALEQRAKRCTARGQVYFTLGELARLSGNTKDRALLAALKELSAHRLLSWSETNIEIPNEALPDGRIIALQTGASPKRPVPLPRRLIRLLARHTKPAEVIAAIAHLIRCMFKRGREITSRGFVRAEWVAEVFGISLRAVYGARKWLTSIGVLEQAPVHQLVMNKHGALCQICAHLMGASKKPPQKFAGLLKLSTRSCTSKNQIKKNNKPASRPRTGDRTESEANPLLRNIIPEDLKRLSRLEQLYQQAVSANWLPGSEQNARNFIAAAARATRVSGDPVRIFVGIVKQRLWAYITQEQENRAIEAFARHERKTGRRFGSRLGSSGVEADSQANSANELLSGLISASVGEGREFRGSEKAAPPSENQPRSKTCQALTAEAREIERIQMALTQKRLLLQRSLRAPFGSVSS